MAVNAYDTDALQQSFLGKFLLIYCLCVLSSGYAGAQADNAKKECVNEQFPLDCPELESVIRRENFKELFWTVALPGDESRKPQEIGYCDENLTCATYDDIGSFDRRIKIRNPVRGKLFVKQLILNDNLTYKCQIERKGNKPPIANKVNVSSSQNCLSATAGQTLNLSQPLRDRLFKENVQDIEWYGILQDGKKARIAYCSPFWSCVLENCTGSCPEYLTRLTTEGLSIILTDIKREDRGLEFLCKMEPAANARTVSTMKPEVYTIRIKDVSQPQVNDKYVNETTATSTTNTAAPTGKNKGSYSTQTLLLLAFIVVINLLIAPYGIS